MTGITGIYLHENIAAKSISMKIQDVDMDLTFKISTECLLTALRNDLNWEVKE